MGDSAGQRAEALPFLRQEKLSFQAAVMFLLGEGFGDVLLEQEIVGNITAVAAQRRCGHAYMENPPGLRAVGEFALPGFAAPAGLIEFVFEFLVRGRRIAQQPDGLAEQFSQGVATELAHPGVGEDDRAGGLDDQYANGTLLDRLGQRTDFVHLAGEAHIGLIEFTGALRDEILETQFLPALQVSEQPADHENQAETQDRPDDIGRYGTVPRRADSECQT